MSIKNIAIALLVCGAITGCQSTRTLEVGEGNSSEPIYENGVPMLKSVKQNIVVVRLLTSEFSKEIDGFPTFFVLAANGGSTPLDFSTANITATSGSSKVFVYSYEALQRKIKRDAALLAFATALNGASQSMNAAMPQTTYSSGTASAYGSGGYAHANYSGVSATYNPAATAAAQAKINANTQNQMAMIASARDGQLSSMGAMLRRETIAPGAFAGGTIKLKPDDIYSNQPIKLTILIGAEEHSFNFIVH